MNTGGVGGASLGGTGGTSACSSFDHIVINELVPNPPSTDNGREWLEIYNPTCNTVDLSGWVVEAGTSAFSVRFTFPSGASIPAMGYVVVGGSSVSFADYQSTTALNMGNAGTNADAVRLLDASATVVDTVIYGTPNSDGWLDDSSTVATSLAPSPTSSQSLSRQPSGVDTNLCGDDFVATQTLTPGQAN